MSAREEQERIAERIACNLIVSATVDEDCCLVVTLADGTEIVVSDHPEGGVLLEERR